MDMEGVEAGRAMLKDYVGKFRDGLKNGTGCSYSRFDHRKRFEGMWIDGQPGDGVYYDMVVVRDKEAGDSYEELFPYWDNMGLLDTHLTDRLEDGGIGLVEALFVDNVHQENDTRSIDHLRPFLEFMKTEDPRRYQTFLEYSMLKRTHWNSR